jgi:HEAT repeat protein
MAKAAGLALTRLPDKGVAVRARELLTGRDAKRQAQIVRLLADRADPNDAGVLCELVSGNDKAVATEAARGLKLAGGEIEFKQLIELLATELDSTQVRPAIETAAARIVKRAWQGDATKVVALLKDAPEGQRASLMAVLGLLGDDHALPAVLEASKAADGPVKDAAVRALADWPTPAPLNELLEFAKATPNEKQHVLAMRGYIRMLDLLKEKPPANLKALYEAGQHVARRDEERRALDPAKASAKPVTNPPVGYE